MLEGIPCSDEDVVIAHNYFLCAFYFHFTPQQVDEMDATVLDELLYQLPIWKKKMKELTGG